MNSLERASDALPSLEGTAHEASKKACASLENEALAGGLPNVDQAVSEAPFAETTIGPLLQDGRSNLVIPGARKARLPDRLMLSSYVKLMEWGHPSTDTSVPGPDATQAIIDRWNPFNKRDSSTAHMRELYLNLF